MVDINFLGGKYHETLLSMASSVGHEEVVRLLLGKGADVNMADADGWTPIHWAAHRGHIEVVRILLDRGADPNSEDGSKCTPLHWAAFYGHKKVVQLLLRRGAVEELRWWSHRCMLSVQKRL